MIIFEIELVQPPSKVFVLLGASSQKSKWWDLETFHMPETWLVVVSLPVSYASVEPTRKVWFQNIMIFHWGCGFMLVKKRCEDLWCLMKPCQFTVFYKIPFQDTAKPWPLKTEVVTKMAVAATTVVVWKGVYLGNLSSPRPLSARPYAPWPRKVHSNCEKISSNNHTLGILVLESTFTMLVVRGCVSNLEVLEFTEFHVLFWVFINHFLWHGLFVNFRAISLNMKEVHCL